VHNSLCEMMVLREANRHKGLDDLSWRQGALPISVPSEEQILGDFNLLFLYLLVISGPIVDPARSDPLVNLVLRQELVGSCSVIGLFTTLELFEP
jgi:hypothetical protein